MDNELFELLPLSGGKFAKIDKGMLEEMWITDWSLTADGYPATNRNGKRVYLHDIILLGLKKPGDIADHINGDKLDNRSINLRLVTKQQNNMNRSANKVRKDTHYKGVILHDSGKWQARIGIDGKKVYLGYFKTPEDAARAYNDAALKHHGEYAKLNDLDTELAELKYKVEELTGWDLKQPDLTSYLLEKLPTSLPQLIEGVHRDISMDVGYVGGEFVYRFGYGGATDVDEVIEAVDLVPLKALLKLVLALKEAGEL